MGRMVVPGRVVRHLTEQQLMGQERDVAVCAICAVEVIFHLVYLALYRVSDHMHSTLILFYF